MSVDIAEDNPYFPTNLNKKLGCQVAKLVALYNSEVVHVNSKLESTYEEAMSIDDWMVADLISDLIHFVEMRGGRSTNTLRRAIIFLIEELSGNESLEESVVRNAMSEIDDFIDDVIDRSTWGNERFRRGCNEYLKDEDAEDDGSDLHDENPLDEI